MIAEPRTPAAIELVAMAATVDLFGSEPPRHDPDPVFGIASGRWIGQTGPWQPEGWPGPEVGWSFLRSSWGKGYAREAAVAAIDWTFANLGWIEVIHSIHPDNHASQVLAQRLGSRKRGPGKLPPPHEDVPIEIWDQTREEWLARRERGDWT